MQKLFDAAVDYPLVVLAANEEFPRAPAARSAPTTNGSHETHGWSAFEIWRSRIRLLPGVTSLFLPSL
jgi:hypothetical protein